MTNGTMVSDTDTVVSDYNESVVADYLDWLENRIRRSENTVRTYGYTLRWYLDWLSERSLDLRDVTYREVEDFANRDRAVAVASTATVRKDVVTVRGFHHWAWERDYPLRTVSTAACPEAPENSPKPVEDDVWRKLWLSDLSDHDRLWLGMGYFAGMRRIEICTITPEQVNPTTGMMRFKRKGGNTNCIEYVQMFEIVQDALPHLVGDFDWLGLVAREATIRTKLGANFLWYDSLGESHTDGNRLNKRLDRVLCPNLGIELGEVTPHRLRHSCATNLTRAGVADTVIMDSLSHSSLHMTRRYQRISGQLARWRTEKGKVA